MIFIRSADTFALVCDECDQTVIVYDPNAERGHPISPKDLMADQARHACPEAAPA